MIKAFCILALLLASPAGAMVRGGEGSAPAAIDCAFNRIYNFDFPRAFSTLDKLEHKDPSYPVTYSVRAAAMLFSELYRLRILEMEFFGSEEKVIGTRLGSTRPRGVTAFYPWPNPCAGRRRESKFSLPTGTAPCTSCGNRVCLRKVRWASCTARFWVRSSLITGPKQRPYSLHVVIAKTDTIFAHLDRFNPYQNLRHLILHGVVEVAPHFRLLALRRRSLCPSE